ncbi:hypothetical protein NCF85_11060 [Qipengyuania citrea]|jgi:hypothetical protein|uniref:Uncharacterized protein n=1 Tax=Qipengyuania citrea TaxID=225971 RepID=A0ABY4U726_9SPHN|nr:MULTISPECIES: hypothetical protein [Qipengyuania]MCH2498273.1 hypothetical protein [Erythrobacter sp.]MEC7889456.1 hypothetical protein [Pseudomonadota bacterium]MBY8333840.1 hypothetical protein [Qipengyuania pacifica]MEE2794133.1 hypothetical protein [Pseudomonadota bacterium]USA60626.1 hypothetical protein NCF85_11060 [Qipengyuania citrea]|tara:strand:- start:87 stop:236 length:150 start_codon:yes stop_codon:yes gene_type:complete
MSRQLTISALAASISMALFALSAGFGAFAIENPAHIAGKAPLIELYAGR